MARRLTVDNDQPQYAPSPAFISYPSTKFDAVLRLVVLPLEIRDITEMLNADFASTMQTLNAYEAVRHSVRCRDHSVEAKLRCLGNLHSMRALTPSEKDKVSAFLVGEISLALMDVEGARNRAKKFNTVLSTVVPEDASADSESDEDKETENDHPPW